MNTECLHLLIVDDEEAHVEAIRRAFDQAGVTADIDAVRTLQEYRERIATHPPDFALIDLNLPDGRATEVLSYPPEDASFPKLVMTALGNQQTVVEVMKAGALDFIVKSPETFASVPQTVERALREWQLLQQRKEMEENLHRTQRIECIGTLAAGIAHDLNNILTPILLSASTLRAVEEPETREICIAVIEQCAQRGADIVNQVLTFTRGTKGKRTILQLNCLLNDMEKIMHETFPKNITITSSVPVELWPVQADPTQIHQVLLNLCINARDAMREGGTLHLSAKNQEVDEPFAAMAPDGKAGDYAMLEVSDSGTGISREIVGKIFDPFFTTKAVGMGTGLGLSTVIGIVRSHGGFLALDSEEGRGSTFKVFLPAMADEGNDQNRLECVEMQRNGGGEMILVVDDELLIAQATALALEKNGYKVLTAAEGNTALALYVKHANEIKIVLADVMLPGMDGVELARSLKKINPQVKIIASTGQATEPLQIELQEVGVNTILRKPYNAKKLLAVLHDAIHSQVE